MGDLAISEVFYQQLRQKPEDELSVREWVQLRFHEARGAHGAEAERLRREVDALRESVVSLRLRAERAERLLQQREAAAHELERELESALGRESALGAQLRACEARAAELHDKGLRFDDAAQEVERLRADSQGLQAALAAQSSAQQQLGRERADVSERLLQLECEHSLLKKDAEAHEKRCRAQEEQLRRREEEAAELRAKVESLKEKKRELVRKAEAEQQSVTQEFRDKVDAEIRRLQEQSRAELEAVRTNLNALHEREIRMLQERADAAEARALETRRRLEDEEHAHQALQLSAGRTRAELQNEITELTGVLKLRAFEAQRATLTHEEVSCARQQLEAESEALKQQVEVLKKEYYILEVQHREGRAAERAELASLREQLHGYVEVERELDAAIRACADDGPPASVDEALLIGTTLASAPTSSQRRIQQSLLLAHELQRRTREAAESRHSLGQAQAEVVQLREELEAARQEMQYTSEPQAYLLDALRRQQEELLALRRDAKARDAELQRSRQAAEQAVASKAQVEEDLRRLLAQREHLAGLRALLAHSDGAAPPSAAARAAEAAEETAARAENRGRAPSQGAAGQAAPRQGAAADAPLGASSAGAGSTALGAGGPAWLQRLRAKGLSDPPAVDVPVVLGQ
ncbi:unnamed protein product [Prorocentrum cordatum]|uniref:Uncharacterized protein n=1 Tax=Prorocentrum cordatum TaxID=2364126 RepID=A0ABN9S0Q8_9DINO|nr:unnamed protein product [Polarella glacialis]